MKKIALYSLRQPALIVRAETGVTYTNQVGGVACLHPPGVEGFLVLLDPPGGGCTVFSPHRWYKEMPALDDALYDEIEHALNGIHAFHDHVHDIRVNRMSANHEAWIHVRFRGGFQKRPGGYLGGFRDDVNGEPDYERFPEKEGVLTWENCD